MASSNSWQLKVSRFRRTDLAGRYYKHKSELRRHEGSTHHFALGVGHQLGKIEKLAKLLDIELAVVAR